MTGIGDSQSLVLKINSNVPLLKISGICSSPVVSVFAESYGFGSITASNDTVLIPSNTGQNVCSSFRIFMLIMVQILELNATGYVVNTYVLPDISPSMIFAVDALGSGHLFYLTVAVRTRFTHPLNLC